MTEQLRASSIPRSVIATEARLPDQLPMNLLSRQDLPREWKFGYAISDMPGLEIPRMVAGSLGPCRVVTSSDQWNNRFFLLLGAEGRRHLVGGTGLHDSHIPILRTSRSVSQMPRKAWVLDYWSGNYFHWLIYHLPKAMVFADMGLGDEILLLSSKFFPRVADETLRLIGVDPSRAAALADGITDVGELIVLDGTPFHPTLLKRLASRIRGELQIRLGSSDREKKVFISRREAAWRRIENEEDIWNLLEPHGFERVVPERLSFHEQVSLFSQAKVIVSAHGAGLANTLFCDRGSHVIEMGTREFPNPDFYRLALSMNLNYWYLEGTPIGNGGPAHRDFRIEVSALRQILERIATGIA